MIDADVEAAETQNWLDFAFACEYILEEKYTELYRKYEEILAMLNSMIINSEKWTFPPKKK